MPTTHSIGPFELSLAQRSLSRNGQPLTLGARAFDLLVALVERRGRLVGKDELLEAVWGGSVVEDGNLHVQVSALRKVLGADAITTIPGRGYRFDPPQAGAAPAGLATPAASPSSTVPGALLFGRDADLSALHGLLASHRLVTIVGPGGIGKTRLARAAMAAQAVRHADGAVLVELAALNDAALIPGTIASALQLPLPGSKDPLQALAAALRPLRVLLVLDNAEHLVDGVAEVVLALSRADAPLQVLVTSQLPLKLAGEQVVRLGGLAVPEPATGVPDLAQALRCGAVALFNDRVQAADRHFRLDEHNVGLAIDICRQLDGIALAIELAAARCPLLGLQGVAQRLHERLRLLRSGSRSAPTRQQTLQAAMDWSHALLTPDQARAFRQLGVFVGGFTLALASPVLRLPGLDEWAGIDLLADLVDRSLVAVDDSDRAGAAPRYRLLETGRAYALDKLEAAGETPEARRRHAQAVRVLFEAAHADGWLMPELEFVARYEAELENLRAAIEWALQADPPAAVALAGASSRLWRGLSLHPEALHRCAQAAALIDETTPPALAARLWEAIAQLNGEIASPDSRAAAQRALALYRGLHDRRGEYLALAHLAFSYRAATPEAEAAFARMRELEDPAWPPALRLYGCKVEGGLASDAGRLDVAKAAQETRLALATAAGAERDVNAALGNLADLALMAGDADSAVRLGRELLDRLGRRQRATRAIALGNLLLALLARHSLADARQVQAEFIGVVRQLDHMFVMYTADAMAGLAAAEGRWTVAAHLMGYADAAYAAEGQPREPNEARARDTAWGLLQAHVDAAALAAGLAAGAVLQPAAVCTLALQG
jgi:predicted ATPase/DNA-binding winged helix-turn-helix (wHTH) protein